MLMLMLMTTTKYCSIVAPFDRANPVSPRLVGPESGTPLDQRREPPGVLLRPAEHIAAAAVVVVVVVVVVVGSTININVDVNININVNSYINIGIGTTPRTTNNGPAAQQEGAALPAAWCHPLRS